MLGSDNEQWSHNQQADCASEESKGCIRRVERKVRVEAEVIIKPRVVVVDPDLGNECCEKAEMISCKKDEYTFVVSQDLCLNIPLRFDAEVEVRNQGIQYNPKERETQPVETVEHEKKRRKPDIDPGWMID
jgi:hypothetical protein